jgi:NADPH:quinone reductase-like Zn-dependent oxidoreductase
MVKSIGADHVIDYKKNNYTANGEKYDLIVDMVGNHSLLDNRDVLTPNGTFVMVGGSKGNWIGPLLGPIKALMLSPFVEQKFELLLASMKQDDLTVLSDLMATGKVTPVIDRHYTLEDASEAIRYSEEGHARGKIIINLE